ncbi:MAG TPA: hypothetical protein DCL21_00945 [Alphaproteobacteria bacterium]|nr:hypothetical protein [Alphaproteobacteria bacterium]
MVLDINNSITSSEGSEFNGRAQNGAVENDNTEKLPKVERSYFQELERGPAKAPPKLTERYNLDESLTEAFKKAVSFANKVLLDDDLTMSLQSQDDGKNLAVVKNIQNEQVVQEYNPVQVLQMYSSNYNLQGIVIDALI